MPQPNLRESYPQRHCNECGSTLTGNVVPIEKAVLKRARRGMALHAISQMAFVVNAGVSYQSLIRWWRARGQHIKGKYE